MTLSVNGSVKGGTPNFGDIIGDVVMASVNANKQAALYTVQNYGIESDAQKAAINKEVQDGYDTQKENEEQYKKEHRHKLMHKIFGAIFHIVRAVVHIAQPRKMIKSVMKLTHPKHAVKSMTEKMKSVLGRGAKNTVKETVKDASHMHTAKQVLKYAEKTANWGQAGLAVNDGIGNVQVAKIKKDIAEIQLAKSLTESIYSSLESEKKEQMNTVDDRISDVISTEKSVNEMINRQSSMQAQLVSAI